MRCAVCTTETGSPAMHWCCERCFDRWWRPDPPAPAPRPVRLDWWAAMLGVRKERA
jgi:hypothetical protein